MTPEQIAWFDSLESQVLTNCRARVTRREGKIFAIEVWAEDYEYFVVKLPVAEETI